MQGDTFSGERVSVLCSLWVVVSGADGVALLLKEKATRKLLEMTRKMPQYCAILRYAVDGRKDVWHFRNL
jgi:hypothetical protein